MESIYYFSLTYVCGRQLDQGERRKSLILMIAGVPQERRRTVNPLRGKPEFLANENIKVNPNEGKQGRIPKKESPGIANYKSDPNRRQKELVLRRPQGNSNKNLSRSNSVVPAKTKRALPKGNPLLNFTPKYDQSGHQKEINSEVPVETFYVQ